MAADGPAGRETPDFSVLDREVSHSRDAPPVLVWISDSTPRRIGARMAHVSRAARRFEDNTVARSGEAALWTKLDRYLAPDVTGSHAGGSSGAGAQSAWGAIPRVWEAAGAV